MQRHLGLLDDAATRADPFEGHDITMKILQHDELASVPQQLTALNSVPESVKDFTEDVCRQAGSLLLGTTSPRLGQSRLGHRTRTLGIQDASHSPAATKGVPIISQVGL